MPVVAALVTLLALSTPGHAGEPIRVVEGSLEVPAEMSPEDALASVSDISRIFELYEPVVPKIPGVQVDLAKEVVSIEAPTILELPVSGNALGRKIEERARVTAVAEEILCPGPGTPSAGAGRKITLDFSASSYNIERRISRIEITACPTVDRRGHQQIEAVGRLFAGYLPEDPSLNALSESIGARALQGAFIKQVPAMLSAVEAHWATLSP
ncbi:MAG TPA: hypothetical protein ENK18_21590 [Deltaproteobacteria bacterium]|nr:hypothetical protein [Deltaproteobacteria bacterium]